jgi:transaldolase / glucose-6-phosphate isomerase
VHSDALAELVRRDAARKLLRGDGSLFSDDPATAAAIGYWTGWVAVIDEMRAAAGELEAWARDTMRCYQRVVVCGMGGSSLAPLVFSRVYDAPIIVLDTTDPDAVAGVPVDGSLFVIASKSGSTLEPELMEQYFWDKTGGDRSRFVVITDPGSQLQARAAERGVARVFENRPDIGGRFSALSYFGLVPAALGGVSVSRLLDRAAAALVAAADTARPDHNTPLVLGATLAAAVRRGADKLTLVCSPPLGPFGLWLEQLLAESTGKDGTGVVPLADEPLGPPSVYGADRVFAYLRLDATHDAAVARLAGDGFEVIRFELADRDDVATQMLTWELATAYCGALLAINPFDQPNVQAAKDFTIRALDAYTNTGMLDSVDGGSVRDALAHATPGRSFVAIQAFVTPTAETEAALQALRTRIRDRLAVATSLGFGPRYLHSTGQLHKGGPRTGIYLQVLADAQTDTPIPGRSYGFRTVIDAQSRGDSEALRATGQPVARITLAAASDAVREALGE